MTAFLSGVVFSLLGTALLYPGAHTIDTGAPLLHKPPYLSGLGPIYTSWMFVPLLALVCVSLLLLILRHCLLRGEDPFHKTLWVSRHLASSVLHTCVHHMLL